MNFPGKAGGRAEQPHGEQQDGDFFSFFFTFYPKESKLKVSALTVKLLVAGTKHGL